MNSSDEKVVPIKEQDCDPSNINFESYGSLQKGKIIILIPQVEYFIYTQYISEGKKSKNSSKERVARWRKNLTEEDRQKVRAQNNKLKQTQRAKQTDEEKEKVRILDKERRAKKRAALSEEEKSRQREKDRLRKSSKKQAPAANWRSLPRKWKKPYGTVRDGTVRDEQEKNREYQEKRRSGRSEAESEFERIQNLLIKRNTRAKRSDEEKIAENETAWNGMQFVPIFPFKSRRKSKGHREEYIWWKFWKTGNENKELLRTKLPEIGAKFDLWDSKSKNP